MSTKICRKSSYVNIDGTWISCFTRILIGWSFVYVYGLVKPQATYVWGAKIWVVCLFAKMLPLHKYLPYLRSFISSVPLFLWLKFPIWNKLDNACYSDFLICFTLWLFYQLCFTHMQDSFTRCFKSNSPEPWNWNIYLFPLWCFGVVIRYGILFPLRYLSVKIFLIHFPE